MNLPVSPTPLTRAWRSPAAWAVFVGVTLALLGADQALKYWAFANVAGHPVILDPAAPGESIPPHDSVTVVPSVLDLHLVANTGAVFGLGQGGRWLFIAVSLAATILLTGFFVFSASRDWVVHASLAAILSGAVGNLYDRVMYSAVRDMLHMLPQTGLWPWIFNIADVALLAGVAGICLHSFCKPTGPAPTPSAPTPPTPSTDGPPEPTP